ncbi:ribosome-associated toxin RatA of RatAB toxin-antitoxin module [Natronocella acetinitrilica]|jgi:ribosome-associated toxin RatA of RatAB toxin-antitoxin module|uniref:Ribosome-associated toxin RatA of RatAB toxin-antitoxin module n=1 Tax=Natronocella acetinitrilica TaxID=414046 RepID=A0AAE3G903_9GAMM|nr:type II toxin-antitoxin system RatA family toxin [Natronocella acetinitrilica]MCP1676017.1 ribosome-associated toxin RatA of RatAB toxin-antitoxin module [Natronocella acetinitrilica]
MAHISRSALVAHTAGRMFELVHDVDQYKYFLPWCSDSGVLSDTGDERKAFVTISKGGISKSFTTLNRAQHGKMLEIRLVEGPFKRLDGYWRFQPLGDDASKVSLDLEFEFSNSLVRMAFGRVFEQLANRLVDSFVQRADQVYGTK